MKEFMDYGNKLSLLGLLIVSSWVLIVSQAPASLLNLGPEELVQANGSDLQVIGCSVPSYVDWNDDGANDLVVGEHISYTAGKIRVYLNIGGPNDPLFADYFYAQSNGADLTLPAEGCLGCFPRVVDWDDDMRKDLLVGVSNGTIRIYLNTGTDEDPAFDSGTTIQVGAPAADLDVGNRTTPVFTDWNGDGLNDLVVGALDAKIHVYFNSGSTWPIPAFDFSPPTGQYVQENGHDLIVPSARPSPDVLDLDGDGKKDLLVGNTEGELLLYINVGTEVSPEFSGYSRVESNGVPIDLESALDGKPRSRPFVCDWTGDGYLDVLVGACDGKVHLYQGRAWTSDLVAHWGLDEADGEIAYDSAGQNDAVVFGDAIWLPEGGVVDGAIKLDGIDDYIGTPFVLNSLTYDTFSIFAWIKGGAPGQVILSQADDSDWLLADSSTGALACGLCSGRGATPLVSDAVITDGNWHRIGLSWDGTRKMLYVDEMEVAWDSTIGTSDSQNGLYVGAGETLSSASFFSGLIDDIRIYSRAVTP
jgi:hypothetical protein